MDLKDVKYGQIRLTLEVIGGDSPSENVFKINNPKQSVVTEVQMGVIKLAEAFAMAHSK